VDRQGFRHLSGRGLTDGLYSYSIFIFSLIHRVRLTAAVAMGTLGGGGELKDLELSWFVFIISCISTFFMFVFLCLSFIN
jgi:hypothetical protein